MEAWACMTLCWVFKACFSKKTEKNISSANPCCFFFWFFWLCCFLRSSLGIQFGRRWTLVIFNALPCWSKHQTPNQPTQSHCRYRWKNILSKVLHIYISTHLCLYQPNIVLFRLHRAKTGPALLAWRRHAHNRYCIRWKVHRKVIKAWGWGIQWWNSWEWRKEGTLCAVFLTSGSCCCLQACHCAPLYPCCQAGEGVFSCAAWFTISGGRGGRHTYYGYTAVVCLQFTSTRTYCGRILVPLFFLSFSKHKYKIWL